MAKPAAASTARIAVVHDWLTTWAGGEQCLAHILAMYPHADLYALVDFLSDDDRARIGGRRARTSFLQRLPSAKERYRQMLPLFPRAVESLDVSAYDLVLSSSHAVAKGVRTHARQLHVCYCYSPMRYAWDLREQYLRQVGLDRGLVGWVVSRTLDRLQAWDRRTSARVDAFVAISDHIADRIRRCYGREAAVIHPPVDLPAAPAGEDARCATYVTVSRLVPYKRVDVLAAAFADLPGRELVVIGEGPERPRIEAAAPPNVRLLGHLPDAERDRWLARARAFLFVADEDFGIAPLEAQARGAPVIAYASGGSLETIRGLDSQEPTGVFFDAQTPASVAEGVRRFESNAQRIAPSACRANAQRFSADRFRREFGAAVEAEWQAFRARAAA